MRKFILYSVSLLWAIVGVFTLNTSVVLADWLLVQETADDLYLPWSDDSKPREYFLISIKKWLGWLVTILAIITMFILVYGGILMITAAGDEDKFKKWFTILKQAAVGLIYIGLAWLFIMLVFYVIAIMVWEKELKPKAEVGSTYLMLNANSI